MAQASPATSKNGAKGAQHREVSADEAKAQMSGGASGAPATAPKHAPPAGYQSSESAQLELAGHWLPDHGPIHGKLVSAYDFRKKSDGQIQRVYVVALIDPCMASVKLEGVGDKSGGYADELVQPTPIAEIKAGVTPVMVGIWGAAGLSELDNLAGCFVYVIRGDQTDPVMGDGGKKLLKGGRKMWLFDVKHKGTPKPLKIRSAKSGDAVAPENQTASEAQHADELPF